MFRARTCAGVAIAHGLRHCVPLIYELAGWAGWSARGELPHPSHERLGHELGVTARTVGEQIRDLERVGIVDVWRTPARQTEPARTWTRQTNRYVLCDRRWQGFRASPIRRRHCRKPQVGPTGSELPVTLFHGYEPGRPVDSPPPGPPPSGESEGESMSTRRRNRPNPPSLTESGLHLGRVTVPLDVVEAVLFDLEDPTPADTPSTPPWIAEGITTDEWIRRQRT